MLVFVVIHPSDIKEEIVEYDSMVVEETIEVSTHESPVKQQPPPKPEVHTDLLSSNVYTLCVKC